MTEKITFGDPPPHGNDGTIRGKVDWYSIADQLRSRPGEWAKIRTATTKGTAGGTVRRIRIGKFKAFTPAGSFEATGRGVDIWARYVGGGAS